MFDSIFVKGSLTAGSVLLTLGLALVLGFAGAFYYIRKNTASRSFAFTLALLPLITATVIMVVRSPSSASEETSSLFS